MSQFSKDMLWERMEAENFHHRCLSLVDKTPIKKLVAWSKLTFLLLISEVISNVSNMHLFSTAEEKINKNVAPV